MTRRRPIGGFGAVAVALAAGLSVGCATGGADPASAARFHEITLHAMPTAINWDSRPGPDGVRAGVYLFRRDRPEALAVSDGVIEFLLYDGLFHGGELAEQPVFHTWRFPANLLRAYRVRSIVGPGYRMQLGWGSTAPRAASLTLVARHVAADGAVLDSRPVTIQMPGR